MKYYFPNTYEIETLSKPETYSRDDNLARMCRHIIAPTLDMPIGEAKQKLLNGEYPELVKPHVDEFHSAYEKMMKSYQAAKSNLPESYELIDTEIDTQGSWALLKPAQFDEDLHSRIKRIGGYWDGKAYDNRQLWLVPLEKVGSLKRIFKNHLTAAEVKKAALMEKEKQESARKEAQRIEREKRWEEEKKQRAEALAAEKARQSRAKSERIKVAAGKYSVGDMLNGKQITGFGQSWTEKGNAPEKYFKVQLWEPCHCGQEPVYAQSGLEYMGSQECEKCINRKYGVDIDVCYAYFS
jgi:hypothetical protein